MGETERTKLQTQITLKTLLKINIQDPRNLAHNTSNKEQITRGMNTKENKDKKKDQPI